MTIKVEPIIIITVIETETIQETGQTRAHRGIL